MKPIDKLLPLLSKLKKRGHDRWIACCPAHDDKSPSLTIRELENNSLLIHCFSGCDVGMVLDAIGLSISDLFVNDSKQNKPIKTPFPAQDILSALLFEAQIIELAASDIISGKEISKNDYIRISVARDRIEQAVKYGKC